MKFEIARASDASCKKGPVCAGAVKRADGYYEIEISTLEGLLALIAEVKSDLLVGKNSIWIYDDNME